MPRRPVLTIIEREELLALPVDELERVQHYTARYSRACRQPQTGMIFSRVAELGAWRSDEKFRTGSLG